MPDLRIHREHRLGLTKARKVAWAWAEEVERKFDMECTVIEGEFSDTVEFTRSGVSGTLVVAADHFDLNAKLGFLLGAFAGTIEAEIEKNLDTLLGKAGGAAAKASARKPAAKKKSS
jgi:putative polyhydroxyalkanoate system protein